MLASTGFRSLQEIPEIVLSMVTGSMHFAAVLVRSCRSSEARQTHTRENKAIQRERERRHELCSTGRTYAVWLQGFSFILALAELPGQFPQLPSINITQGLLPLSHARFWHLLTMRRVHMVSAVWRDRERKLCCRRRRVTGF